MLCFQRLPVTMYMGYFECAHMLMVMLEQFRRDTPGAVPVICSCWLAVRVTGFDKPFMISESARCCLSLLFFVASNSVKASMTYSQLFVIASSEQSCGSSCVQRMVRFITVDPSTSTHVLHLVIQSTLSDWLD